MNESNKKPRYRHKSNREHRHRLSKMQIVEDSIKTISKEYCAESSICGLKHLVDDKTPYFERIIWIFTMVGALVCSITLVWLTFKKYYMAPLVTTQVPEGISVSEIVFPAVGICSNNRISKKAVTKLARELLQEPHNNKYNESQMLSMLLGLGQIYDLQMTMEDELHDPVHIHRVLGNYSVKDLFKRLTPTCDSLLLRCTWNEQIYNCTEIFDFRLTMNGFCCTFNYLRHNEDFDVNIRNINMYNYGNKSAFDYDQGLKILVRFHTSDDFYYNLPLMGALLQFSDAYDFPDAPSGSFSSQIISPGVQMTVLVSASVVEASRDIQHIPVDLRGCLFYDESPYLSFYTFSDCMLKCRLLFLVANCNCTPFNMPNIQNYRTCNLRDVPCLRIYYAQSIAVRPDVDPLPPELELDLVGGGIFCPMCYPTCSKATYSYEFNNVKIFPEFLNNPQHDDDMDDWLRGSNFTGASIVHVKYASEFCNNYGQNVIMKWFDLFSNIGSTCGFITGFSFVSVLEFFYFFTIKLSREIRSRQLKNGTKQEKRPPPVTVTSRLEPVARYRAIYWNELGGSRFNHHAQIHHYDPQKF